MRNWAINLVFSLMCFLLATGATEAQGQGCIGEMIGQLFAANLCFTALCMSLVLEAVGNRQ